MDPTARDIALVLIGFLPLSLGGWALLMLCAGFLKDERDQPAWYRWLAPRLVRKGRPAPSLSDAGVWACFIGVLNFCPVLILIGAVVGSVPLQILVVDLAYLLVQAILVAPLFRGVLAARRRGRQ